MRQNTKSQVGTIPAIMLALESFSMNGKISGCEYDENRTFAKVKTISTTFGDKGH